jgi:predicted amidohydrolase YtcJ
MIQADVNFVNGKIYTMVSEQQTVSAFSVIDGKIVAAGTSSEIARIPAKQTIDLKGAVVLPGFQDTHCHIAEAAEGTEKVDLSTASSMDEVVGMLRDALNKKTDGGWLTAYQVDASHLKEKRLPDRFDLDKVSETIPVFISANCLHNFMCNTAALKKIGVERLAAAPEKDLMITDENGSPTGRFREHCLLKYINSVRPCVLKNDGECKDALEKTLLDFASKGVTTVHTYDGFDGSRCDSLDMYQMLERECRLPIRAVLNRQRGVNNSIGALSGFGNERIKYGAVKLFADGSFSQRSAYVKKEYSDQKNWYGIPVRTDDQMFASINTAYEKGNDVAVHVIGDGALDQVLSIIKKIYDPSRPQQFRLIHMLLAMPDQLDELAGYPVVVDTQPVFIPNMGILGKIRLGEDRARYLIAMKSMLERGIIVSGGDDAPISNNNPFVGIRYAVTRETYFGSSEQLYPEECLSVYQAVCLYTKNAAYDAHEENLKGTIEVGKLADAIVIDRDIFTVSAKDISSIKVLATYVGGKAVKEK